MKRLKNVIFIMLVLLGTTLMGQTYTFRVLANKGANKLKKPTGEIVVLKTGAIMSSLDNLITGEDSYIGLMHKSGKTIEINTKGTFAVKDLETKVIGSGSTIAGRYAKFISDKMNETENGNYKSRMNATGSVSRGSAKSNLSIMAQTNSSLLNTKATIRWHSQNTSDTVKYTIIIRNILDEIIQTYKTNKTSIEIDFDTLELETPELLYIVTVSNSEMISDAIGINRNVDEKIIEEFEKLKEEIGESGPLSKLIFASFFEENELLLDALYQYEKAISSAPDVADFKELYRNFLITNDL